MAAVAAGGERETSSLVVGSQLLNNHPPCCPRRGMEGEGTTTSPLGLAAFLSVVLMVVTDTGQATLSTSQSPSTAASLSPRSGASTALAASFRLPILRTLRKRWGRGISDVILHV